MRGDEISFLQSPKLKTGGVLDTLANGLEGVIVVRIQVILENKCVKRKENEPLCQRSQGNLEFAACKVRMPYHMNQNTTGGSANHHRSRLAS